MSEPKRWLEQGASADIERLVRAAQAEQPDSESLRRSLAAVGVGLGTTSVAAGAKAAANLGGAAKVTVPMMGGVLAKGTALGMIVAALAAGASKLAIDAPHVGEPPKSSAGLAPRSRAGGAGSALAPGAVATTVEVPPEVSSRAAQVLPPAPAGAVGSEPAPAHVTPRSVPPSAAPTSGVPFDADTLAQEVARIDRARAALAAGRAAETLVVLDDYERRFPRRGFAPEALFLRMEACTSLGRAADARAAAQRLLQSYPNSLHEARARAVLARNP